MALITDFSLINLEKKIESKPMLEKLKVRAGAAFDLWLACFLQFTFRDGSASDWLASINYNSVKFL